MRNEQMQFACYLRRQEQLKGCSDYTVSFIAGRLFRFGRAFDQNAVNLCNIADYQDRRERLNKKLKSFSDEFIGAGVRFVTGGDPRGCCLKVAFNNAGEDQEYPIPY
jgi:hypothetical protein